MVRPSRSSATAMKTGNAKLVLDIKSTI